MRARDHEINNVFASSRDEKIMNIAADSIAKGVRGDAIFVLINLLARLSNKAARMRLGAMGTWPGQIPIVLCLLAEEGLSQKELIERTRIEQSTMAEHLDRMDRDNDGPGMPAAAMSGNP